MGLEEMFVTMAQGLRDESSIVDPQLVVDDARDLYLSGKNQFYVLIITQLIIESYSSR